MLKKLHLTPANPSVRINEESGFCELNLLSARLNTGETGKELLPCIRFLLSSPFYRFECRSYLKPGSREFIPMDLLLTAAQVPALEGAPFYTLEIRADWPEEEADYHITAALEVLHR